MSGHKDHIKAYMISCKISFQLMATVFKENLPLLAFHSSIVCLKQHLFQNIAENRLGVLLEINDKFITKLNVFSYTIM